METRVRLAAAVAVASVAATALIVLTSHATGGSAALAPDLVTLAIQEEDLVIEPGEGDSVRLRLTNEIGNHANGPLEVFPGAVSADCDGDGDPGNDRDASQRVFADTNGSGAYETGSDQVDFEQRFGCMRYHPTHDHWHVLDIARYELRLEASGKLVGSSRKVGFCLTDTRQAFPVAASPAVPTYPLGSGKAIGCDATSTQGISAGWVDIYSFALPGQDLDLTGLPRGHYCLTSRADPLDLLDELIEDNNVRRVRIALRPRKLRARKLDGPCRI